MTRFCTEVATYTKSGYDPAVLLLGVSQPAIDALERLGLSYDVIGNRADMAKLARFQPRGVLGCHEADFTNPAELARLPVNLSRYDRVLSFTEDGLLPAAVCNAISGSSGSLRAAYLTRNKAAMRRQLNAAGLSNLRFGFGPPTRADRETMAAGSSVISKPVDGSSSVGVSLVSAKDVGSIAPNAYWEEFVNGDELSIEYVSHRGQHEMLGVTQKFHSHDGRFIEVGHIFPATLDADVLERISAFVPRALDALGVVSSASHTEVKIAAVTGSVEMIETHTRPGGDAIPQLAHLVTGRDQYREAICAELNDACGWVPAGDDTNESADAYAFSLFGLGEILAGDILDACGHADDISVVDEQGMSAEGAGSFARTSRIVATTSSPSAVSAVHRTLEQIYGAPR